MAPQKFENSFKIAEKGCSQGDLNRQGCGHRGFMFYIKKRIFARVRNDHILTFQISKFWGHFRNCLKIALA